MNDTTDNYKQVYPGGSLRELKAFTPNRTYNMEPLLNNIHEEDLDVVSRIGHWNAMNTRKENTLIAKQAASDPIASAKPTEYSPNDFKGVSLVDPTTGGDIMRYIDPPAVSPSNNVKRSGPLFGSKLEKEIAPTQIGDGMEYLQKILDKKRNGAL